MLVVNQQTGYNPSRIEKTRMATDAELVEAYTVHGDKRALDLLYSRYADKIYRYAFAQLHNRRGSHDLAEDFVQDIFCYVAEHLDTFRGDSLFSTWLWTIVRRQLATRVKSKKFLSLLEAEPLEESAVNEAMKNLIWDTPEQANRLLKRGTIEKVQAAIRTLPEHLKEIIKLRDIECLDYDVISRILGISYKNAKSRTHRARKELRKKLENVKDDLDI